MSGYFVLFDGCQYFAFVFLRIHDRRRPLVAGRGHPCRAPWQSLGLLRLQGIASLAARRHDGLFDFEELSAAIEAHLTAKAPL
jgi:hypothetical protein